MAFVKELRPAFKEGAEAFAKAFESNVVGKALLAESEVTLKKVGKVAAEEFIHTMRSGEIATAFKEASSGMETVLKDNKVIVETMEREAAAMPESTLKDAAAEAKKVEERLPGINKSAAAEDIEREVAKDPEIQKKLESIEKDAKSKANGKMVKYTFLGVAIVGSGLAVYDAIEAYARKKTGCFLYTQTSGGMTTCKVVNASCLNPKADDSIPTCTPEEMGEALNAVSCKEWSESSDGACYHCSHDSFDESQLANNQTLVCVEKPSVSEAIGDIIYSGGETIINGVGDIVKKFLYYGGIGLVIIVAIYVIMFLFRTLNSAAKKMKAKQEAELRAEQTQHGNPTQQGYPQLSQTQQPVQSYQQFAQPSLAPQAAQSYQFPQATPILSQTVAHITPPHSLALAAQSHAIAAQSHAIAAQSYPKKKYDSGLIDSYTKVAYVPPPYVETTTF